MAILNFKETLDFSSEFGVDNFDSQSLVEIDVDCAQPSPFNPLKRSAIINLIVEYSVILS